MFQHSIQSTLFQDTVSCQDVKTADLARLARGGKEAGKPVGGDDCAASAAPITVWGPDITPDNFEWACYEAQVRDGRRKAMTVDREAVTVALPPACNTGVTDTLVKDWREKGLSYRSGVDTIEGTFPLKEVHTLDRLLPYLVETFGGGQVMQSGMKGYPCQVLCTDGVRLLYNPEQLRQGLHLIMSGEANQRHCLRLGDSEATVATFIALEEFKFKYTRIDLYTDSAVDTMDMIWAALRSQELVTRTRAKGRSMCEVDLSTGETAGNTLYIGSVKSDRMTRLYDKASEQNVGGVWTRCELQCRRGAARVAAAAWLSGKFDVESIIAAYIDFREVTGDSNKTRRPRVSWWSKWLGSITQFKGASIERVAESVKRSLAWFKKQVAPTYAFLLRAMPDADWLMGADVMGEFRMSPAKRAVLASLGQVAQEVRDTVLTQGDRVGLLRETMQSV